MLGGRLCHPEVRLLHHGCPEATASRPMQAVGLDLFHARGRNYLVMVDQYSGYPLVQCLSSTTAAGDVCIGPCKKLLH